MVTGAKKIESGIHANIEGKVLAPDVSKEDRVTPGETLVEIG